MPRSLNIARYPQHLFDLLSLTLPQTLHLSTKREAERLRFQIWGFRDALAHAQHPGAAQIDAMLLRIEGAALVIEARDDTDAHIAAQLRQAQLPPPLPPSPPPPADPLSQPTHEATLARWLKKEGEGP